RHHARDLERCPLGELAERLPRRVRDLLPREDGLQIARPVAQRDEGDLTARAGGHHPAAHGDGLTHEPRQRRDAMKVGHRRGILVAGFWAVHTTACAPPYVPPSRLGPARQGTSWPVYLVTLRHDSCLAETLN